MSEVIERSIVEIDRTLSAMREAWMLNKGTPRGEQCMAAINAMLDRRIEIMDMRDTEEVS